MNPQTRQAIESILMVADQPVEPSVLAQLLEVPRADIERACDELSAEYEAEGRGFVIVRVAGGYRFQSHPDLAPYVERFVLEGQSSRLSSAALETLAIVAYKQPISRMQVAAIRGVNVDGVLRTLQQRGYVDEIDRDSGPGNAVLFGTTSLFLERVGLNSLDDLPPLAAFVPGADVVEALEEGLRPEAPSGAAAEAAALVDDGRAALPEPDEHDAGNDEPEGPADIDLTEPLDGAPEVIPEPSTDSDDVTAETTAEDVAPADSRTASLSPGASSSIRHDVGEGQNATGSFRATPGARTGDEPRLVPESGMVVGQDPGAATEAPPGVDVNPADD